MSDYKEIYRVDTQEDYDALMVELENKGYIWSSGSKPTDIGCIGVVVRGTIIYVDHIGILTYGTSLEYENQLVPYKAPIERAPESPINTWENCTTIEVFRLKLKEVGVFIGVNLNRDDRTVRVTTRTGKNIVKITENNITTTSQLNGITDMTSRIKLLQLAHDFQNKFDWSELNKDWYIALPGLVTTDGRQQYLTFDSEKNTYFSSRFHSRLKQTFTESELSNVPEMYKPYVTYGNLEKENE